jgi:hypothetical protein
MKQRSGKSSAPRTRRPSAGAVAANFHEGSRSEVLADYLFSAWGTVTPTRRQDDYGVDLYCTLNERVGGRARVTDYFVVQVKSTDEPWHFSDPDSVRWLVEYPVPIFLAWVDKKTATLRIYHVFPRFMVAANGHLPAELTLVPKNLEDGSYVQWGSQTKHSLSAPILRVTLGDFMDGKKLSRLRGVFTAWVRYDRENLELLRRGLFRFRMPASYKVNQDPHGGIVEQGLSGPEIAQLNKGISAAAEAVECIGGQLGRHNDRAAALFALLFVNHVFKQYPDAFKDLHRWSHRFPGDLGGLFNEALNAQLPDGSPKYLYEAIDEIERRILSDPPVSAYLKDTSQPDATQVKRRKVK